MGRGRPRGWGEKVIELKGIIIREGITKTRKREVEFKGEDRQEGVVELKDEDH